MGLILCPECGRKISDKALTCPQCGFTGTNMLKPISEQDKYEAAPEFKFDIEAWSATGYDLNVISYEDNRTLVQNFGTWEKLCAYLPTIAKFIKDLADKEPIWVANISDFAKKQIANGRFSFIIDKAGHLLGTIINSQNGKIVEQVRLEEMKLGSDIAQTVSNLANLAALTLILANIKSVGMSICDLHIELQNDRLAMAESAKDKLRQAYKIQDAEIRSAALLNTVNTATDAKRRLMRNFSQNRHEIEKHDERCQNMSGISSAFDSDARNAEAYDRKAADLFADLVYLTNAVQIECAGYAMLGEYEACKECLESFKTFVIKNRLNQRDTLLMLNGYRAEKNIGLVDSFSDIADKITAYSQNKLDASPLPFLTFDDSSKGN